MTSLLIGAGAGFSGDRVDAALPVVATLIARGGPSAIIFETLAERTLALAQLRRRDDPEGGYEPLLDEMLTPILALCVEHGVRIVGNFGAANPPAAARRIAALAGELGLRAPRIAVVRGDDVSSARFRPLLRQAIGPRLDEIAVVSANAYLGAEAIAAAFREGAEIVVAGRVADPSLTLGVAMAHFAWAPDDWDRLGRATIAGHLLECGAQVTGGYFADPGRKDVPDLHDVGFPIAEIHPDGEFQIFKADRTGGCVTARTVKEQILYEVHDPAAYLTPDVTADISEADVTEIDSNRVRVSGVRGHPRPDSLKVNVCHEDGWLAEGEISYAGPGAEARARLAANVLERRLPECRLRVDLIGVMSILGDDAGRLLSATPGGDARDVRLRVATSHRERRIAERLTREVGALYTCGPAGGGGVRTALRPRLDTLSCLLPRSAVAPGYEVLP